MAQKPSTLTLAEIRHARRSFHMPLTEKEKAFLIEAAASAVEQGQNWSLAGFIRDAAIDAAERELKKKFKES